MVLYAPTFRRGVRPPVIHGVNVVVKHHYFDEKNPQPPIAALMLAADVLITDYSSVMFDFALLDRPIVIYAPDWEEYVRSRGVYFDLIANPPGLVATTEEELQRGFDSGEVWAHDERRQAFRERFCQFDDGKAAERVVRHVFLGERS
jgi:CDP-glycerol glycerophosphotransferase